MKVRYKGMHFVPERTVTLDMLRNNSALRKFARVRRLIMLCNLLIPVAVVLLLITGVI